MKHAQYIAIIGIALVLICAMFAATAYCQDDSSRNILKQGLLGAGTGAIAAGASGGNAGKGALIGAGTNVIGNALLDALTGPSQTPRRAPQPQYYDDGSYYYEEPAYYEPPPQQSQTTKILKQGLVGAGTGALAAGMSKGNAGQGALIGAGTSIIGNALLDTLTQPAQQRSGRVYHRMPPPQYRQQPQQYQQQSQQQYQQRPPQQQQYQQTTSMEGGDLGTGQKRVIKKYDENGKLVSEEEIYY